MSAAEARPMTVLGEPFSAPAIQTPRTIVLVDKTSPGTWSGNQLRDTVWSARYAALYYFNRSPWVGRGYVPPIADVKLLSDRTVPGVPTVSFVPIGAWIAELADTSDQPGAIGYHEGQATHVSKMGPSGVHSTRALVHPPAYSAEAVVMRSFVKTAREDNAYVTEVITHELFEAAVNPYVNNENEIRAYLNPVDGYEYIGEVGDPVQGRAFDVGAPAGRPCGVPEAFVADFAYPWWWRQPQGKHAVCFTQDASQWNHLLGGQLLVAFQIAKGGYMSRRKPGEQWEQLYGEDVPHRANPL